MKKGFAYLVRMDVATNRNAYIKMIADNDIFTIEQGRVGATPFRRKRPMSVWNDTYEKYISDGYEDKTDLINVNISSDSDYDEIDSQTVRMFIDTLMKAADRMLEAKYSVTYEDVTGQMIDQAQDIIYKMSRDPSLANVNALLPELFKVIPRKMKIVEDELAAEHNIQAVIQREQSLLDIMSSKVSQSKKGNSKKGMTILDAYGLEVTEVTDEKEISVIKKHMASESSGLFRRAYRVKNKETDSRFYAYMKKYGYNNHNIHYFYHGSRTENFWGLITEGQKLNPKAHITGKMFGYGLYYASRAKKSINYTSLAGSYWANGHSKRGYLAVYKVLYRDPLDVYAWNSEMTSYTGKKISPHDALYAHAGQSLYNDEIIVYNEAQATLQYIIEIG